MNKRVREHSKLPLCNKEEQASKSTAPPAFQEDASPDRLTALPKELILQICEHLAISTVQIFCDAEKEIRALAAFARTCRYLNPIVTPFLYSRYQAPVGQPLTHFLFKLASQPELGKCIKHISIYYGGNGNRTKPCEKTLKWLQTYLLQLHLPYGDRWLQDFPNNWDKVVLGMVVSHAQNAETLYLPSINPLFDHTMPVYLEPIFHSLAQLPANIEKVECYARLHTLDIDMNKVFSDQIPRLFLLPSLRNLRISGACYQWSNAVCPWPTPPKSSNVKSLRFDLSRIPSSVMVSMINSCKAISLFQSSRPKRFNDRWITRVLSALEEHHNSLQRMVLDVGYLPWRPDAACCRINNLHRFDRLELLMIPFVWLMGKPQGVFNVGEGTHTDPLWDDYPDMRSILPPSLTSLLLECDRTTLVQRSYDDIIMALLTPSAGNSKAHPLKDLTLRYFHAIPDAPLAFDFLLLQKSFDQSGIQWRHELTAFIMEGRGTYSTAYSSHLYFSSLLNKDDFEVLAQNLAGMGADGYELSTDFQVFADMADDNCYDLPARVDELLSAAM